jgi:hypothetical protein
MRRVKDIRADLSAALADHHANSQEWTAGKTRENDMKIKGFRQELSDVYSEGAKPCPKCGNAPHGMDRDGKSLFEVGCLVCPPEPVIVDGEVRWRKSWSSQGRTPQEAVEMWNDDQYLIDKKLDAFQK